MTCSFHILNLWYGRKKRQYRNPLLYYLVYKEKQLSYKLFLSCVYYWKRGMNTSRSPLTTLCYCPFIRAFIYFDEISQCQNFQQVHSIDDTLCYYMHLLTRIYVYFKYMFEVWPDENDLWMLRWLKFWIFQVFDACKDNFIYCMLNVWPDVIHLKIFHIRQGVVCIR